MMWQVHSDNILTLDGGAFGGYNTWSRSKEKLLHFTWNVCWTVLAKGRLRALQSGFG